MAREQKRPPVDKIKTNNTVPLKGKGEIVFPIIDPSEKPTRGGDYRMQTHKTQNAMCDGWRTDMTLNLKGG